MTPRRAVASPALVVDATGAQTVVAASELIASRHHEPTWSSNDAMHTPGPRWVKSAGSGLVGRPSGLPSAADILLRCREPPLRAKSRP